MTSVVSQPPPIQGASVAGETGGGGGGRRPPGGPDKSKQIGQGHYTTGTSQLEKARAKMEALKAGKKAPYNRVSSAIVPIRRDSC